MLETSIECIHAHITNIEIFKYSHGILTKIKTANEHEILHSIKLSMKN